MTSNYQKVKGIILRSLRENILILMLLSNKSICLLYENIYKKKNYLYWIH